jgi:hypothetical protein
MAEIMRDFEHVVFSYMAVFNFRTSVADPQFPGNSFERDEWLGSA